MRWNTTERELKQTLLTKAQEQAQLSDDSQKSFFSDHPSLDEKTNKKKTK